MSDNKDTSHGDAHVRNRKKEQIAESHRLCLEAIFAKKSGALLRVRVPNGRGHALVNFDRASDQFSISHVNRNNEIVYTKIYVPQH
jgi:hypothetical protein